MTYYLIAVIEFYLGYLLGKTHKKAIAKKVVWFLPLLAVTIGYLSFRAEEPWYKMLALIFLLFLGMKSVAVVFRYASKSRLSFVQWFCFAFGWIGMDSIPFEQLGKNVNIPTENKIIKDGIVSLSLGVLILFILAILLKHQIGSSYLLCLFAFPAFILIFHSGIFNLVVAFYRRIGVNVLPLMNEPLKSNSVGDFWGVRWNVAFIQMSRITLFIPLSKKLNKYAAFVLAFLISGMLHEIAISLPVNGGYGLPNLYFLLQAVFVLLEKKFIKKISPSLQRLWTFGCLLIPFPLLFHPPFLKGIILPFLELIGKTSILV